MNWQSADFFAIHFSIFAGAAFPRTCGGIFSATQKIPSDRTFTGVNSDKFQTVNSLQPGPIVEERDDAAIAVSDLDATIFSQSLCRPRQHKR